MELDIHALFDGYEDEGVPIRARAEVSPDKIREVVMERIEKTKHRPARRLGSILLVAAVFVLLLTATAFATGLLRIEDLRADSELESKGPTVIGAGWPDSAEYQAEVEWQNYKWEHSDKIPGPDFVDSDMYTHMGCFDEEDRAALDAVLERYQLRLPEDRTPLDGAEGLYARIGQAGFLPERAGEDGYPFSGEYYRGGTFYVVDNALVGDKRIRYDLNRRVKGLFVRGPAYSLDTDGMEQWDYTTADGTPVLLALGRERAALVASLEKSFVYIHIRQGSETGYDSSFDTLTQADLEAFADSIDFAAMDSIR